MPDQPAPPTLGRMLLEELRRDPELQHELRRVLDDVRVQERLLTTREAAKILGVHPGTLTQMARDGRISGAQQLGNRWRFSPTELALHPRTPRSIPASGPARPRAVREATPAASAILGGATRKAAA